MSDDRQYRATLAAPIVEGLRKRFAAQEIYIPKYPRSAKADQSFSAPECEKKKHQSLRVKLSRKFQKSLDRQQPNLSGRIQRLRKAMARFLKSQGAR